MLDELYVATLLLTMHVPAANHLSDEASSIHRYVYTYIRKIIYKKELLTPFL